ncbi:predicted protein [Nematostella vectensis]|uniref:AIG1-type G domain-containing protein n=1 Tax=Nematostella vectensis TaxID=45351 RepID=A7S8D1_NEMVE|nr:translocase of chloroplast 34, chloroplastic [Nematostella vectensis]EDO40080.1 predicted protein [Nematostella vectensis]|eukprot:XP_001632143.1 predicted protein [Nematostella vectensis]
MVSRIIDLLTRYYEEDLEDSCRTFKVIVVGRTGVGKSHLVNTLMGEYVVEEGQDLDPCTSTVSKHEKRIGRTRVTVWDSPGLQDGHHEDEVYLNRIKPVLREIDVMLYCIKMDDTRFIENEVNAIRAISSLDRDIWRRTAVILTFANKVRNQEDEIDIDHFRIKKEQWKSKVTNVLMECAVSYYADVPFVPAGHRNRPELPSTDDWVSDFWLEVFRASNPSRRLILMAINQQRLTFGGPQPHPGPEPAAQRYSSGHPLRRYHPYLTHHRSEPGPANIANASVFPPILISEPTQQLFFNLLGEGLKEMGTGVVKGCKEVLGMVEKGVGMVGKGVGKALQWLFD